MGWNGNSRSFRIAPRQIGCSGFASGAVYKEVAQTLNRIPDR